MGRFARSYESETADDWTRTSTLLPRADFESAASTIPPHRLCDEALSIRTRSLFAKVLEEQHNACRYQERSELFESAGSALTAQVAFLSAIPVIDHSLRAVAIPAHLNTDVGEGVQIIGIPSFVL